MPEPQIPPLRRQVEVQHPVEKSLRVVILLQALGGLALVGTIWASTLLQASPECSCDMQRVTHIEQSPAPTVAPAAVVPCGAAQVVPSRDRHALEIRFDNCANSIQPAPLDPPPIAEDVPPTEADFLPGGIRYERYRQQNNTELDVLP
jgi:hypothetical protein